MKKNLYYRAVLNRPNKFKEGLFAFFLITAPIARMLLEVFIRRNFGRRYFSFSLAVILAIMMVGIVKLVTLATAPTQFFGGGPSNLGYQLDIPPPRVEHGPNQMLWFYIYLGLFLVFSFIRQREINRTQNEYDFNHFSLSSGIFGSLTRYLMQTFKVESVRTVETVVEPGVFFALGLLLTLFSLNIGIFLLVASVCYSLSYVAAYWSGDNFVLDKIDERICNEELERSFVDGLDSSETKGVRFYGRFPSDRETRRKVAESFVSEDEDGVDVE